MAVTAFALDISQTSHSPPLFIKHMKLVTINRSLVIYVKKAYNNSLLKTSLCDPSDQNLFDILSAIYIFIIYIYIYIYIYI